VLSARDREAEKIDALDRGANDYVNKPFAIGELLARLRAALRDFGQISVSSSRISSGNVEIDTAAHTVVCNGAAVHLTPKEFDLLAILVRNSGRVITHRQLLNSVWGPAHADDMQYLRVFIGQLRHKLERDAERPQLIMTEPGIGYRFVSED
jgi:two-component system KDP operon response regulator KdpE